MHLPISFPELSYIYELLEIASPKQPKSWLVKNKDILETIRIALSLQDLPDDEVAYLFLNGLSSRPTCHCGAALSWFDHRYAKHCSRSCASKSNNTIEVARKGYELKDQSLIKDKTRKTRERLYGEFVSPKHRSGTMARLDQFMEKSKQTLKERHGVENPSHTKDSRKKANQTRKKTLESNSYKEKQEEDRIQRYSQYLPPNETILSVDTPMEEQANVRIKIECDCGAIYTMPSETMKFRVRNFGKTCNDCSDFTPTRSIAENNVGLYIESLGFKTVKNDRSIIAPYEIDIFVPQLSLAIEYCGIYHHREKDPKDRKRHQNKLKRCRDLGIRLITIFENEWIHTPLIVKSMLKNALNIRGNLVHARKCKVVRLKNTSNFLKENHLHGAGRSKVKYGLVDSNGTLVSVMTFSSGEISRRSQCWEINRFASLLDHNIPGAASKLFKAFIDEVSPDMVVSYADLRWGTGAVYEKLGFSHNHDTVPNYWYIDKRTITLKHRYGLRKRKDEPKHLTEWELRQAEGWDRIWDCGHAKWIWRRE